jgi:sulfofructose kinase
MTDSRMNFHDKAPKIPPRILCIGMPVRDLTFRVGGVPARGSKENATHFEEICGGNALNAAIGIVRLGGRASICGPMGDVRDTSDRYILDKLAHEGIETKHVVHMPGLVTPISAIMIDPSGERTIVTFRDPELWKVHLPPTETLLDDCAAILTESRCAEFCTDLCAEAVRRGIPVIVDVDRAMSLREGLLNAGHHLARRERGDPGDAGLPGSHRGYAGRRRRVPRRLCARHHREAGTATGAPIRLRRRSAEMHPVRGRLRGPATC